jgi:hypothetical protein
MQLHWKKAPRHASTQSYDVQMTGSSLSQIVNIHNLVICSRAFPQVTLEIPRRGMTWQQLHIAKPDNYVVVCLKRAIVEQLTAT